VLSSSPDLSSAAESAKDAAADAKSAVSSGFSAVPNSTATVADQNADVRGLAENYRDPAGAIQQDKAASEWVGAALGALCSAMAGSTRATDCVASWLSACTYIHYIVI
jgi:phage-related minor tail protein